jgi:hypothetical protein
MFSYKSLSLVQTMATSIASDRTSIGASRIFSCPYSIFQYRGKDVFPDGKLIDGSKCVYDRLGNLLRLPFNKLFTVLYVGG